MVKNTANESLNKYNTNYFFKSYFMLNFFKKENLANNFNLYQIKIPQGFDLIEIDGGYGDLGLDLINAGYNLVLFLEPDKIKYEAALEKIKNVYMLNKTMSDVDLKNIKKKSSKVFVVMQDVIEHIPKNEQKNFFEELLKIYDEIKLIGRTPNLKSTYGLRNSFGDNTHIHRFTDGSLKSFLNDLGFYKITIHSEPYQITGLVSFLRYFPYLFVIGLYSISFFFVFGQWEGLQSPNLIFQSSLRKN